MREDYCCEQLELVENYAAAKAENFKGWCIHHRLEIQPDGTRMSRQELKDKDLYFNRPASELVFMRCEEHTSLHHKDKVISEETRQKLSETHKGDNNPLFGKHHSEETRKKMSVNNGRFWKGKQLSAEHRQKLSESRRGENHPLFGNHHSDETRLKIAEANKGKHWWNDSVSCKYSRECPGEGWTRGRLRFK